MSDDDKRLSIELLPVVPATVVMSLADESRGDTAEGMTEAEAMVERNVAAWAKEDLIVAPDQKMYPS